MSETGLSADKSLQIGRHTLKSRLIVGTGKGTTLPKAKPVDPGAVPVPQAANNPIAASTDLTVPPQPPVSETNYLTIALMSLVGIAAVAGILLMARRKPRGRYASKRTTSPAAPAPGYQPDLNLEALETPPRRPTATAPKAPAKPTAPPSPPTQPPPQKPKPTRLPNRPKADES